MEAVTRLIERRPIGANQPAELAPTLTVTACYLLSENGRKASLLRGGDGRAVQNIKVNISATRLHLVSVDREGVARLKLRPRYETDAHMHIVRIDATPVYDAPPSLEELMRIAARNHELELIYQTECQTARARRREEEREFRSRAAHEFLLDRNRRALAFPAPSPSRCYIMLENRRLVFDVADEEGLAREVPAEAYSRFCDDESRNESEHRERGRTRPVASGARPRPRVHPPAVWARNRQPAGMVYQAAGALRAFTPLR
jgi:hypothetical protein